MTTPAAPEWHIKSCAGCPFEHEEHDKEDVTMCIASTPWRRMSTRDVLHADTPPDFCPLRAGPRVVKLAEEG